VTIDSKAIYVYYWAMDAVESLASDLNSVAIHLVRRLRRADATLGITPARLSALSVLVFAGACSMRELADAEQVTGPTMSKIVSALEADRLVRREPDATDARAVVLSATERGRRLMEKGRRQRVERLAAELRQLPDSDVSALQRATRVLRALE
jgi:DNA-binding MarR family transcriptional regulator